MIKIYIAVNKIYFENFPFPNIFSDKFFKKKLLKFILEINLKLIENLNL